jgi:hypothetical protein
LSDEEALLAKLSLVEDLIVERVLLAKATALNVTVPDSELDKAYEEARAAHLALKEAEARRDQGIEATPGDRQGTSSGGTRPTEQYFGRQQLLEHELEMARRRYDAALKRWNDLK